MTPSHSTHAGTIRYRYYVCSSAQKKGWHTCPSKSIPAAQIEDLVVRQIKAIGQDPLVLHEVLAEAPSPYPSGETRSCVINVLAKNVRA
jgi:site-specific DNA recombinase